MKIEQYWGLLIKQWKVIVICFIAVGVGTYIGSKLMTPIYQSTTLVQVVIHSGATQADINSLLASDQLVQTESLLATSDPVLREVASHYTGLAVEQLSKEATSTTKTSTQVFEIDVLDPSSTRAAALANDVAQTLIKQQLQAAQQDNARSQQQIQQDLTATRIQIDTITTQIAELQAKGGHQAQIVVLQGQLNALQQHYSQWQASLAQLELTQAQNADFLRIVQPAQPGIKPVQPNVLLDTIAGLLAGLFLGILLAIMFDRLDMRVRTPENLDQLLDWPVLATIWNVRSAQKKDVFNPTGRDVNVESYRILRTNIGFSGIDKPLHSLVVTSALPGDGKSSVAANLAIFMAKAGKTTLLIDADLRRPSVHELFGLPADKMGLSNAVLALSMPKIPETPPLAFSMSDMPGTPSGESGKSGTHTTYAAHRLHSTALQPVDALTATNSSLEPFVHSVGIPNLWVMPSGPLPPNPPELLDSKAMQRFLALIANYGVEVVIFDTPPVLGLSDVSILASKVDATLFVADITRANKKNLKQAKVLLEQASSRVLGCVVNKQRRSRHDSTAYSYYYYRAHEQDGKKKHNMEKKNSSAVPTVPVNAFKQPDMNNGEANHNARDVNLSQGKGGQR